MIIFEVEELVHDANFKIGSKRFISREQNFSVPKDRVLESQRSMIYNFQVNDFIPETKIKKFRVLKLFIDNITSLNKLSDHGQINIAVLSCVTLWDGAVQVDNSHFSAFRTEIMQARFHLL